MRQMSPPPGVMRPILLLIDISTEAYYLSTDTVDFYGGIGHGPVRARRLARLPSLGRRPLYRCHHVQRAHGAGEVSIVNRPDLLADNRQASVAGAPG